MADRPTRKETTLSLEWPFIRVREKPEERREHGQMALVMAFVTVGLLVQSTIPAVYAALTAFISGHALNNWMLFEDAYEEVPDK